MHGACPDMIQGKEFESSQLLQDKGNTIVQREPKCHMLQIAWQPLPGRLCWLKWYPCFICTQACQLARDVCPPKRISLPRAPMQEKI